MRVVYSGGTICSFQTLQRLILLADEIAFMDRPSVTFGNHGTVGSHSEFRRFQTADAPISFAVYAPPSGPASDLYRQYVQADLADAAFIKTVFEGIRNDSTFRARVISSDADYGWGTGNQIVEALTADASLLQGAYEPGSDHKLMFVPDTNEGRRQTFGTLLLEASIHATNAMLVAEAAGLKPVSDDPYFCQLLAIRTSRSPYVAQPVPLASVLSLGVARSVIPDESLARLSIPELFAFRRSASEQYAAWSAEMERLSLRLLDVPPDQLSAETARILVSEVQPRMLEVRRSLEDARDRLYGDLFKSVLRWEVPTLSVAYLAGLSLPAAIAAFAASLAPAASSTVDYFVQRRAQVRNNSMAYLVGVKKLAEP